MLSLWLLHGSDPYAPSRDALLGVLMACAYLGFCYGVAYGCISWSSPAAIAPGRKLDHDPTLGGIPLAAIVFHEVMTPIFLMGATCLRWVYLALARPNKRILL